jgi:NAD(P)-dependent dehydrogenase (short-subunit alcohol dehydrogenase family)
MTSPAEPESHVALVSGGTRGLGRAVARALAASGERVHVLGRGAPPAELERELEGRFHRADATRADELERAVAAVRERDGRLDHVVHAVGDYATGPLEELRPETLRALLESNLESAVQVANAVRPSLRERGGRLVFFGCAGVSSLRGRRSSAAYAAAKTALLVLVRSWALEEARHSVTVNLVSPGHVPHPDAHPETLDEALWRRIPAGRAGRPEEVAEAVRWLCSDGAAYTTGSDLEVGGGWML